MITNMRSADRPAPPDRSRPMRADTIGTVGPHVRRAVRIDGEMSSEPTRHDIDALVGPATPHFAYQLRARVHELVRGLPADHEVRVYGEQKMAALDALGHASSRALEGHRESPARPGWENIPSSATAGSQHPHAS